MGTHWEEHTLFLSPSTSLTESVTTTFDESTVGWTLVRTLVSIAGNTNFVIPDDVGFAAYSPTRFIVMEYGSALNPLPDFPLVPGSFDAAHVLASGQIAWHTTMSHRPRHIAGTASVDLLGNLTYDLTVECVNYMNVSGQAFIDSRAERRMTEASSGLLLIRNTLAAPSPPGEWNDSSGGIWATVKVLFETPG